MLLFFLHQYPTFQIGILNHNSTIIQKALLEHEIEIVVAEVDALKG